MGRDDYGVFPFPLRAGAGETNMSEFNRSSELSHILKLQEEAHDGRADLKADMWDRRVKNWKQNFWNQNLKKGKAMDRIMETADYLRVNGVLGPVSYTHLDVYKRQAAKESPGSTPSLTRHVTVRSE